jgi:hypothetical protein
MTGLTAKVFRTYNASFTMSNLLRDVKAKAEGKSIHEKIKLYNDCNRQVAILCNHKRTVGAAHETQMEKLNDRVKGVKYQMWRTKQMILDIDTKQKKKLGADFFALDPELDNEWIKGHLDFLVETERTKITKKFQKDNEKLIAEGSKAMPDKELKDKMKAASELESKLKKEHKSKKVEAEGKGATVEKFLEKVKQLEDRITALEAQTADREGNKEVALGTSKIVSFIPGSSATCEAEQLLTRSCYPSRRTTSIPVYRWSFATRSVSRSRRSSRRRSGTSSSGPSSRWATMTRGSFKAFPFVAGLHLPYKSVYILHRNYERQPSFFLPAKALATVVDLVHPHGRVSNRCTEL